LVPSGEVVPVVVAVVAESALDAGERACSRAGVDVDEVELRVRVGLCWVLEVEEPVAVS
jgi:hypothetical protein